MTNTIALEKVKMLILGTAMISMFSLSGGCAESVELTEPIESNANETTTVTAATTTVTATIKSDGGVLGEGSDVFAFRVVDGENNAVDFEIHTDKATVGEALMELGLIAGEDGEFGVYVKEVNGISADYEKDGAYWAFYIDGAYAMSGVDSTAITDGTLFELRVEKA